MFIIKPQFCPLPDCDPFWPYYHLGMQYVLLQEHHVIHYILLESLLHDLDVIMLVMIVLCLCWKMLLEMSDFHLPIWTEFAH